MFIYVMILTHLMIIVDRYRLMQGLSRISTLLTSFGVWMLSLFLVLPYQPYISYIDLEKYLGTQFHHVGICTASITGYVKQYTRALVQVIYLGVVLWGPCGNNQLMKSVQIAEASDSSDPSYEFERFFGIKNAAAPKVLKTPHLLSSETVYKITKILAFDFEDRTIGDSIKIDFGTLPVILISCGNHSVIVHIPHEETSLVHFARRIENSSVFGSQYPTGTLRYCFRLSKTSATYSSVKYFAPVCMMSCLYLRMHRDLQRRRMYWDVVYETRTSLDSVSSPTTCRMYQDVVYETRTSLDSVSSPTTCRMYWDVVYETRTSLDSVSSPTTCRMYWDVVYETRSSLDSVSSPTTCRMYWDVVYETRSSLDSVSSPTTCRRGLVKTPCRAQQLAEALTLNLRTNGRAGGLLARTGSLSGHSSKQQLRSALLDLVML
ncbi:hypothetical protein J6590_099992 [Homalodisca vitripennis]|nr:hypothetical protein J6590_099992 [Homalodisca vitripennis]